MDNKTYKPPINKLKTVYKQFMTKTKKQLFLSHYYYGNVKGY